MGYVKQEVKKVKGSNLIRLIFGLAIVYTLCFAIINMIAYDSNNSIFRLVKDVYDRFLVIFVIVAAFISTQLITMEYQGRTYIYMYLRPIKYYQLYFSKLFTALLSGGIFIIASLLLTWLVGVFKFYIIPFSGDSTLAISGLKMFLYCVHSGINMITIFALVSIISFYVKSQFSTILIVLIVFFTGSLINISLPLESGPVQFELLPYMNITGMIHLNLPKFSILFGKQVLGGLLTNLVLLTIGYFLNLKIRKGEVNV